MAQDYRSVLAMIQIGQTREAMGRQTQNPDRLSRGIPDLLQFDHRALCSDPDPVVRPLHRDWHIPHIAHGRFEEPFSDGQKFNDGVRLLPACIFADEVLDPFSTVVDRKHSHSGEVDSAIMPFRDFDQGRPLTVTMSW
jgi:hypothetical protein